MKRSMVWGLIAMLGVANGSVSAQEKKDTTGRSLAKPNINLIDSNVNEGERGKSRSSVQNGTSSPIYSLDCQGLPIKPTRTISFTTDEGSNMDVDVSPDGKTLLFDLLGDLYTLPMAGGKTTQLTRGMAINRQPVWSPDGKRIVYISDFSGSNRLNVRDISGKFHVVLGSNREQIDEYNDTWPVWTSDGDYIAIERNLYGVSGGSMLLPAPINNPIRFSVDGRAICYIESSKIFRYNFDNNLIESLSPALRNFESGTLSPDGQFWVYIADSNSQKCLIVRDLLHNTERILVRSLVSKYCFYSIPLNTHYAFSPDSKSIFIGYGGKIHRVYVENSKDIVIPFTAKVNVDLGSLNYNTFQITQDSIKVKYTRGANSSPDGKHIVFSALGQLYIVDLPNARPRLLCEQSIGQYQPIYSPDNKWIAYVSWCDTIGGFLWRVSSSGGKPEQLTFIPGQYQRPTWSPDCEQIAVVKAGPRLSSYLGEQMNGQLELISVNNGLIRVIDDTVPLWNKLAFSPDGRSIIYEPKKMATNDNLEPLLVSKQLGRYDFHILAVGRMEGNPAYIKEVTISPNGQFVVYSLGEDLYLVPFCIAVSNIIYDSKQNIQAIRFARGLDPFWEKGGRLLSWSYGNRFYMIDPNKILAAAEQKKALMLNDSNFIKINIKPDQIIPLNLAIPRLYAQGELALVNVRIITMRGNEVIDNGTILIDNGRFVAVGSVGMVNIPKGAKVLNLRGTTVMPGLVDIHLHMHLPSDVFPNQSWMFLVNLAYGVTTARDPRTNVDDFGYGELLAAGKMIGPRLYPSGESVNVGLHMDDVVKVDNIDDARAIAQKRAVLGGTFVKQYLLPTRLQRQWLLMASAEEGLNMTNEGDFSPISDIGMMKDGSTGVEHDPVWGDVYKDMTIFIAKTGTYFTPTLQIPKIGKGLLGYFNYLYWHEPAKKIEHFMPETIDKWIFKAQPVDTSDCCLLYPTLIDAQIRKQGGLVTLGSHGNDEGVGAHNELWALKLGGLSAFQALQAGTIMGAKAIGIQKDVGSIEVGKIADLIILNKNPLDDIHNSREIRYVMKDGILYDGDTLDEVWPIVKKCPEWRLKGSVDSLKGN